MVAGEVLKPRLDLIPTIGSSTVPYSVLRLLSDLSAKALAIIRLVLKYWALTSLKACIWFPLVKDNIPVVCKAG